MTRLLGRRNSQHIVSKFSTIRGEWVPVQSRGSWLAREQAKAIGELSLLFNVKVLVLKENNTTVCDEHRQILNIIIRVGRRQKTRQLDVAVWKDGANMRGSIVMLEVAQGTKEAVGIHC